MLRKFLILFIILTSFFSNVFINSAKAQSTNQIPNNLNQQITLYSYPDNDTIKRYNLAIISFDATSAQLSSMRALNPNIKLYIYRNFLSSNDGENGLDTTLFRENGWLLKDISDNEVSPPNIPTEHAVDPANTEYRTWLKDWCSSKIALGYDGIFADNMPSPTYPASWSLPPSINPRTGEIYTDAEWYADTLGLTDFIRTTTNIIGNGIPQADGQYGYYANLDKSNTIVSHLDGILIEGPIAWSFDDFNSRNSSIWKQNMDLIVQLSSTGKMVLFSNSGSSDMETNTIATFAYCSYMLVAESNTYLKFRGEIYMSQSFWTGLVNTDCGVSLGKMYAQGSEYRRDYTNGYYWVNPTTKTAGFQQTETQITVSSRPYVSGTTVYDPQGKIFYFNSWNLRDRYTEEDIKWLYDNGYNGVRLVLYWSTIEKTEGNVDFTLAKQLLDACAKYHMWVWVDFHQWEYSPYFTFFGGQGGGFPSWLVKDGGYTNDAAGQQAFSDDFFLKRGYGVVSWEKYVGFMTKICDLVKPYDNIFCVEPLNEPMVGASHIDDARVACNARYTEMIQLIRGIMPDVIVMLQSIDVGFNYKQNFPNLIWTQSAYKEYGAGTTAPKIQAFLEDKYKRYVVNMGVPFFISETGVLHDTTQADGDFFVTTLLTEYNQIFGSNGGGWTFWLYDKAPTSGGYICPRTSDGSASWLQPIIAKNMNDKNWQIPIETTSTTTTSTEITNTEILTTKTVDISTKVIQIQTKNSEIINQKLDNSSTINSSGIVIAPPEIKNGFTDSAKMIMNFLPVIAIFVGIGLFKSGKIETNVLIGYALTSVIIILVSSIFT